MTTPSKTTHGSARVVVLMGVSGCGKTTIGKLVAQDLGWTFVDADDYHSQTARQQMAAGRPLGDAERLPWLQALGCAMGEWLASGQRTVLACSALKAAYRQILRQDDPRIEFVLLEGPAAVIRARMEQRRDHFMPPGLLDSQLALLEPPPNAPRVSIDASPEQVAQQVCQAIASTGAESL